MENTRKIDFTTLSLRDALDFAALVEEEAQERYEEFTHQMESHHNPEAAQFFKFMAGVEAIHEKRLREKRQQLFGDQPRVVRREMIFDIEAPEYTQVRAEMSVRQAMNASLRAETKAHEFFNKALEKVTDKEVIELFTELRADEAEHIKLVEAAMAKLPPDPPGDPGDYSDDPVAL